MNAGMVKHYNADRGFGFIARDDGSPDLFFHVSGCADRFNPPARGERVSFAMGKARDGRERAEAVTVID